MPEDSGVPVQSFPVAMFEPARCGEFHEDGLDALAWFVAHAENGRKEVWIRGGRSGPAAKELYALCNMEMPGGRHRGL